MKNVFLTLGALLAFGIASAQTDTARTNRVKKLDNSTQVQTQSNQAPGTDVRQRRTTTQQPRNTSTTTRRPAIIAPGSVTPTSSPAQPTRVQRGTSTSPTTTGTNNNNNRGSNKSGTNNPAGTSGSGNPTRP